MKKNTWQIALAFAAVYIVWGSTYIAILIGLKGFPPFFLSGFRFLAAGIALSIWCVLRKERMPAVANIRTNALLGAFMLTGGTVSVTWAEQYLPSSIAAIIVTTVPLWFVVFDRKQWHFYFSNKMIVAGLVLGFVGVLILIGTTRSNTSATSSPGLRLVAMLSILFGGIAWTLGSLHAKYKPSGNSVWVKGAIQLTGAGLFCFAVSLVSGEAVQLSLKDVPSQAWMAVIYLAVMGSLVTYVSYLFLLKVRPPAQVSTYVYVNPVVAVLLGALLVNERITAWQVVALTIILLGVLLVNLPKYTTRATVQTA